MSRRSCSVCPARVERAFTVCCIYHKPRRYDESSSDDSSDSESDSSCEHRRPPSRRTQPHDGAGPSAGGEGSATRDGASTTVQVVHEHNIEPNAYERQPGRKSKKGKAPAQEPSDPAATTVEEDSGPRSTSSRPTHRCDCLGRCHCSRISFISSLLGRNSPINFIERSYARSDRSFPPSTPRSRPSSLNLSQMLLGLHETVDEPS